MNKEIFSRETKKLDIGLFSKKIKDFFPEISGKFTNDKEKFISFWKEVKKEKKILNQKKLLSKENIKDINEYLSITKKYFLNTYANVIYQELTNQLSLNIRVENLCYKANEIVPYLLPSREDIDAENKLFLKDKEGLEKEQGIFLSAILKNRTEGTHLCKSMLLPTELALNSIEEFNIKGRIIFDGAVVEKLEDFNLITLDNPEYLNAEDNRTLIPLEAAMDLALLCNKNNICLLRGARVTHSKYSNKRIFGAGINLTHLYEGKIPYLWYITRDMGAVNKVLRGLAFKHLDLENPLFPSKNKIWFACLETFAIGGACQYLLVMDHILAEKNSYMTLPARKEGIIPGAANLRLWRFVGNRVARQAIQHGLRIKADSPNGIMICDQLEDETTIYSKTKKSISDFKNSGVVGASFNKRALNLGEESIDDFRKYMAIYCHDQAYCHFSKELIKNLEKYWHKAKG